MCKFSFASLSSSLISSERSVLVVRLRSFSFFVFCYFPWVDHDLLVVVVVVMVVMVRSGVEQPEAQSGVASFKTYRWFTYSFCIGPGAVE